MTKDKFPSWAVASRSGRLKYVVRHLANFASEDGHLVFLCNKAGLSVRGVSQAIERGEFTYQMANKLITAANEAGDTGVDIMNILDPMSQQKEGE